MSLIPRPRPDGKEFLNTGLSLGLEELRRLVRRDKRQRVISLEEKQAIQKRTVQVNREQFVNPNNPIDIFIIDLVTLEKIQLQAVPPELGYEPEANWAIIAPQARNNPFRHYVSGDDLVKLTLDWFHFDVEDRTDVLTKCKFLESRSRNNGFEEEPHRIQLLWGSTVFNDAKFIVESAAYTLSQFHKDKDMMPTQAYQSLVLRRVTETNRTSADILKITS